VSRTHSNPTSELQAREARALDEQGFVVLEDVVGAAALERLRSAFEAACTSGAPAAGRAETGTRHPGGLEQRDEVFASVLREPRVLALVQHVLQRPFRLLFLAGRDPLPGFGLQGLHTDWFAREPNEPFAVVTALWVLDDFTSENGAPRLLPGSHLVPRPLPKAMQVPAAHHAREQLVLARAGSVLVFNGHLAHSGTLNRSRGPRRSLHSQWIALDRASQAYSPETAACGERGAS
jgi:ectoine hydroxylase-related dioxygenase (phytanoyl-CoA dioxygenase family)